MDESPPAQAAEEPEFIHVVNWRRYQHYGTRRPPWIKLYMDLLSSYAFMQLRDGTKWHIIGLLLLASRHSNCIPYDEKWIRSALGTKRHIDFTAIFASGILAPGKPNARPLREEDEEKEVEKEGESDRAGAAPPPRSRKREETDGFAKHVLPVLKEKISQRLGVIVIQEWAEATADAPSQEVAAKAVLQFVNKWDSRKRTDPKQYAGQPRASFFRTTIKNQPGGWLKYLT